MTYNNAKLQNINMIIFIDYQKITVNTIEFGIWFLIIFQYLYNNEYFKNKNS